MEQGFVAKVTKIKRKFNEEETSGLQKMNSKETGLTSGKNSPNGRSKRFTKKAAILKKDKI
jgi:hypothetical protein